MRNHVRDRMQEITEYISETDFYIRLDKWNVPFHEPYVLLMRNHVPVKMQEITEYIIETDFYIWLNKLRWEGVGLLTWWGLRTNTDATECQSELVKHSTIQFITGWRRQMNQSEKWRKPDVDWDLQAACALRVLYSFILINS